MADAEASSAASQALGWHQNKTDLYSSIKSVVLPVFNVLHSWEFWRHSVVNCVKLTTQYDTGTMSIRNTAGLILFAYLNVVNADYKNIGKYYTIVLVFT